MSTYSGNAKGAILIGNVEVVMAMAAVLAMSKGLEGRTNRIMNRGGTTFSWATPEPMDVCLWCPPHVYNHTDIKTNAGSRVSMYRYTCIPVRAIMCVCVELSMRPCIYVLMSVGLHVYLFSCRCCSACV